VFAQRAMSEAIEAHFGVRHESPQILILEDGPPRRYYRQLSRMSAAFVYLSDTALLILGGELKRKERLSARFGDVLSHLYMASAVLKRFEDQGRPPEDLPLVEWALDDSLYRIQCALEEIMRLIREGVPESKVIDAALKNTQEAAQP